MSKHAFKMELLFTFKCGNCGYGWQIKDLDITTDRTIGGLTIEAEQNWLHCPRCSYGAFLTPEKQS